MEQSFVIPHSVARSAVIERASKCLAALPVEMAWRVTIEEIRPARSLSQNRMLWAMYADILRVGGEAMGGWTGEDLHEFFLIHHFGSETKTLFGRKRLVPLRRSSKLNKKEFAELVETILRFMAEQGVFIGDPR